VPWLRRFYSAPRCEGLKELVSDLGDIDARDVSSFAGLHRHRYYGRTERGDSG
jgi:hypothetical protein